MQNNKETLRIPPGISKDDSILCIFSGAAHLGNIHLLIVKSSYDFSGGLRPPSPLTKLYLLANVLL